MSKHYITGVGIKWELTAEERAALNRIMARIDDQLIVSDPLSIKMDINACHCNGCPLDLEKLLAFDDANFFHDLYGIRRHINRKTGQLEDCFLPRCAKPKGEGQ